MAEATDNSTPESPFASLPFYGRRKGHKQSGQSPRLFWSVKPSGQYGRDCNLGQEYALQYLAAEEAANGGTVLAMIVADMPRGDDLTGIEIGFLNVVAFAARDGAPYARNLVAHWKKSMAALRRREKRTKKHKVI